MSQIVLSNLKPFVKWVGGKTQFLEIINLLLPSSYNKLIEPFVGGGATFLKLKPAQVIINDTNHELITAYQLIKDQPQAILKILAEYEKKHGKNFYEELRKQEPKNLNDLEMTGRFIYLNKTGFNGLYRVNSQGIFNVPFGQKDKVKLADKNNILAISEYLNTSDCQILNKDYQELLIYIKEGDFLFVDPPYDSEKSNGFTEYTVSGFSKQNQKELSNFLKKAEKKGAKWLLTNHATPFIQELYKDYSQFTKKAYRYINCHGDKRVGTAREIFIWNYELTTQQKEELEFEKYFDTIQHTNIGLGNLVDWEKIRSNLTTYEKDLDNLNSLLGDKESLASRIEKLWEKTSQSFQLLPILLAVKDEDFGWLVNKEVKFWGDESLDLEKVKQLIIDSSLADLFTGKQIKNLKDYAWGIEVGLDTHARKNRSGKLMEQTIEKLLIIYNIEYKKQIIFALNGKKKLDFWWKIKDQEYYCEVNFFNTSGSKISETIRSYTHLYQLAQKKGINFFWIGDGKGLKSVKEALKNAFFNTQNFLFTITSFEEWLKNVINR